MRRRILFLPAVVAMVAFGMLRATAAVPEEHAHSAPPRTGGEIRNPPPAPEDDPDSGIELIGTPAPPFLFDRWVRGPAVTVEQLRGRVVLVRFWTEQCRYCRATLPALEKVRVRDAARGLVVIGAFHPGQPGVAHTDDHILAVADSLGFDGPIACDQSWRTLGRWWLDGHPERNWVSCSFLIGRNGRIRWVHGGGEYHPGDDPRHHRCDVQFAGFEQALDAALDAP